MPGIDPVVAELAWRKTSDHARTAPKWPSRAPPTLLGGLGGAASHRHHHRLCQVVVAADMPGGRGAHQPKALRDQTEEQIANLLSDGRIPFETRLFCGVSCLARFVGRPGAGQME